MPKAVQSKVLSRFPVEHAIAYGLKVLEQSPATGEVVSVQCQFCVYFSVEEGSEPRQRAKKETRPEPITDKEGPSILWLRSS